MEPLHKILTAATELFTLYGFKSITMDDVARRAGISKKTLYVHFANKEEVVKESVVQFSKDTGDCCMSMAGDSENSVEAMVKIMAYFDDMLKRINPMALFELQRFFPEAYRIFRSTIEERDVKIIRDNITKGITEGLYREGINADLLARFWMETSLLVFQPNLMVNDRNTLKEVALEIDEHFMYGIMTASGQQLFLTYKAKYLKKLQ